MVWLASWTLPPLPVSAEDVFLVLLEARLPKYTFLQNPKKPKLYQFSHLFFSYACKCSPIFTSSSWGPKHSFTFSNLSGLCFFSFFFFVFIVFIYLAALGLSCSTLDLLIVVIWWNDNILNIILANKTHLN